MLLKSITPYNLGPFAHHRIEISDSYTVITGANDVGKTCLLQLIAIAIGKAQVGPGLINNDYRNSGGTGWIQDKAIRCEVVYRLTDKSAKRMGHYEAGDLVTVNALMAPKVRARAISSVRRGDSAVPVKHEGLPFGIASAWFPPQGVGPESYLVRGQFKLDTPNIAERALLSYAFSETKFHDKLREHELMHREDILIEAEARLNEWAASILGERFRYTFVIKALGDGPDQLGLFMRDEHGGRTVADQRGAGVRKIVSVMAQLLPHSKAIQQIVFLLDEPEASLHPDWQHAFRRVLETIGRRPNVQVICATHSPCMLNSIDPSGIRLITRGRRGARALAVVDNSPFDDNLQRVRVSLGMSPADSLLYGPLTIIVEGKTERLCIPPVLLKLERERVAGFDDVSDILSQAYVLDGGGENYGVLCRFARAQPTQVVVFLDGEKKKRFKQQLEPDELQAVPHIFLDDGEEFEDLVEPDVYFDALHQELPEVPGVSLLAYMGWHKTANLPSHMMFSKRVERWLGSLDGDVNYYKPKVMQRAVAAGPLDRITEPMRKLMAACRAALRD